VFNFNESIARMSRTQRESVLAAVRGCRDSAQKVDKMAAVIIGAFRHGNELDIDALIQDLDELHERAMALEAVVYVGTVPADQLPEAILSEVQEWLKARGENRSEAFALAIRTEIILVRMRQPGGKSFVHFKERP
jgi:hypothetical protein